MGGEIISGLYICVPASKSFKAGINELMSMIKNDYVLKASAGQVSSELSGDAVILNIKSGKYFGLDNVGTRVWSILQKPVQVKDLIESIAAEYDISGDRIEKDLHALLEDLLSEELIEIEKNS
jgi:hypothetical protein